MSAHLKQPQLWMDYLLPAGQEKFPLQQVAKILSPDDGSRPVSAKSIQSALQAGHLFGNRIPLASKLGESERIRLQWLSRADLLQALLATRTTPPSDQLGRLLEIIERLPGEAQDEIMRRLVALRSRRPITTAPVRLF